MKIDLREVGVGSLHLSEITKMAITVIAIASAANADIYSDCEASIASNDTQEVERLASTMRRFTDIPIAKRESASICVSAAVGSAVVFDSGSSAFIAPDELENFRQQQAENYALREAERSQRERERFLQETREEALNVRNQKLISDGVHTACTNLFVVDEGAAMTNIVCIESFRQNGHPNLFQ